MAEEKASRLRRESASDRESFFFATPLINSYEIINFDDLVKVPRTMVS